MTNLEDQLRQRLRTTAERVVVPPTSPPTPTTEECDVDVDAGCSW